MKIKMKNKWYKKYIKLMTYLNFNSWKIPEKKFLRLNKKLSKLKCLSHKETMKNLEVKEKKNMKNKWHNRYIKLKSYLNSNSWKISRKKYFRLNKKLNKLKCLSDKEAMKNLRIKEKKNDIQ